MFNLFQVGLYYKLCISAHSYESLSTIIGNLLMRRLSTDSKQSTCYRSKNIAQNCSKLANWLDLHDNPIEGAVSAELVARSVPISFCAHWLLSGVHTVQRHISILMFEQQEGIPFDGNTLKWQIVSHNFDSKFLSGLIWNISKFRRPHANWISINCVCKLHDDWQALDGRADQNRPFGRASTVDVFSSGSQIWASVETDVLELTRELLSSKRVRASNVEKLFH